VLFNCVSECLLFNDTQVDISIVLFLFYYSWNAKKKKHLCRLVTLNGNHSLHTICYITFILLNVKLKYRCYVISIYWTMYYNSNNFSPYLFRYSHTTSRDMKTSLRCRTSYGHLKASLRDLCYTSPHSFDFLFRQGRY